MEQNSNSNSSSIKWINVIFALLTANVGYSIHNSIFWSIIDFIFYPIAWIKWIICHEVTLTIIEKSFNWFLK